MRNEDRNGINPNDWMTHEEFTQIFTPATAREQELFDRLVAFDQDAATTRMELEEAHSNLESLHADVDRAETERDAAQADSEWARRRIQDLEEMLAEVASEADAI